MGYTKQLETRVQADIKEIKRLKALVYFYIFIAGILAIDLFSK